MNEDIIDKLQNFVDIQTCDGTWDYDPYLFGMANGLILALATAKGKNPEFLDAPEKFTSEPENPIPEVIAKLSNIMHNDPVYAWGWLCNIAVTAQDEGMSYSASNRGAARFMRTAFGVDMTKHENFPSTQENGDEIYEEVVRMAVHLWRKHYKEIAPNWKPLDTTAAVLSQIDNMIVGI